MITRKHTHKHKVHTQAQRLEILINIALMFLLAARVNLQLLEVAKALENGPLVLVLSRFTRATQA